IYQAFHMDQAERHNRMHRLRDVVHHRDIIWWANNFLEAAIAKDLRAFPAVEDYMPEIPLASD
ncbi:MAG: trehalose-6-phosphate synthase, partial [Thermodesulfobacteriota bacterium]|nr:trehalose-6-phosphate synthase [Thermodesulfobacteriota bacterium]